MMSYMTEEQAQVFLLVMTAAASFILGGVASHLLFGC
jgi:hypothetical protein